MSFIESVGSFLTNLFSAPEPPLPPRLENGFFFGVVRNIPVGRHISLDGHILIIGGAGSGKSSCLAIPTLKFFWGGRFLAIDIKGELEQQSQREGLIFNPYRHDSMGYDPFYIAHESDDPAADIRDIVLAMIPELPDIRDPFWIQSAQSILTGFLLLSFRHGASFIQALNSLTHYSPEVILQAIQQDPVARKFVMTLQSAKPEMISSISTTLHNYVIPFLTDRAIAGVLSKQPILTPDHLEQGYSIYLQIPQAKIEQNKALFTLILQQFLRHFERRPEGGNPPVLLLLDEFARFGRLEAIHHGLATLRSKKITICIIIQSLAQLDAIYGTNIRKIILDNCVYKAILNATDPDTQQQLSRMIGTYTAEKKSFSQSPQGQTITTSTEDKPRIRPEEFGYLQDVIWLHPWGAGRLQKTPHWHLNWGSPTN